METIPLRGQTECLRARVTWWLMHLVEEGHWDQVVASPPQWNGLHRVGIAALGEELGWSGYAIDPMQARWGALKASILLGIFWAVYHYIS
jgi:membrane protease YdiL (CAAX protease family)